MKSDIDVGQVVEVIRLKVPAAKAADLVAGRPAVDDFVHTLAGHRGTEMVQVGPQEWLVMIRWESEAHLRAAQKVTESAPVIQSWFSQASAEFVSFDTTTVRYVRR